MVDIVIKDSLRQSVELASGGKQTVLYTPKGQPSFMNIIPKETLGDYFPTLFPGDTTVHPAFKINGKVASRLYVGTYPGTILNGEMVSQPGNPIRKTSEFVTGMTALKAISTTTDIYHAMTLAERALFIAIASKSGLNPWGLNERGTSNIIAGTNPTQYRNVGLRTDGALIINGVPPTDRSDSYSGSGPVETRLDGKFTGISDVHFSHGDIVGDGAGTSMILNGLRFFAGELQILADNNAASINDLSVFASTDRSAVWKAIDGTTGLLVTPTYTGSIPGTDLVATTPNSIRVLPNGTYLTAGYLPSMTPNSFCATGTFSSFRNVAYNLTGNALKVMQVLGFIPTGLELAMGQANGNTTYLTMSYLGSANTPNLNWKFVTTHLRMVNYGSLWSMNAQGGGEKSGQPYSFRPFMYRTTDLT